MVNISIKNIQEEIIFIWKAHVTNWFWRKRKYRRWVRGNAFAEKKLRYFSKYIDYIRGLEPKTKIEEVPKEQEKIFTLWLQGLENAPLIVKNCINSLYEYYRERLIVLDEKSIGNYISLPEYIIDKWKNGSMIPAHFSDIIRIELLHKYGGLWFDATDFMVAQVPEEILKANFFMFVTSPDLLHYTLVQNYFIRSKKGDPLLDMWRSVVLEYWRNEEKANSYYLVQFLFRILVTENSEAKELFAKMPKIPINHSQVLWHVNGNDPYSEEIFAEMRRNSFLQKCTFKKKTGIIREILPGSMVDKIVMKN